MNEMCFFWVDFTLRQSLLTLDMVHSFMQNIEIIATMSRSCGRFFQVIF